MVPDCRPRCAEVIAVHGVAGGALPGAAEGRAQEEVAVR